MACTGGCSSPAPETVLVETHQRAIDELNKATRLLCAVMQTLEDSGKEIIALKGDANIKELAQWWKKHKELDKKRLAQEALDKEITEAEEKLKMLKLKRGK